MKHSITLKPKEWEQVMNALEEREETLAIDTARPHMSLFEKREYQKAAKEYRRIRNKILNAMPQE